MPLLLLGLLFFGALFIYIRLSARIGSGDDASGQKEVPRDTAGGTEDEEVRREGNVIFLPHMTDRSGDPKEE